ncbi:hypothetical protein NDU88_003876 [Pleurodeles waltl]|uniref:Uncharacterized protein n=1 Tax=Pleurodeles waltl TaxID=8319 RepID=A0AAV7WUA2_PLEWA|nr:hypothetical protein NDU88_003876 [Pleurodeles waltl]
MSTLLTFCDGPALPVPSVEAACADDAVCDPELKDGVTSPFWFPGLKEVRRRARVVENADEEGRWTADEEENEEDARVWERDDGRQKRPLVQSQETRGGKDASGALTAAQEAHREDSSHASGEAWHHHVRS